LPPVAQNLLKLAKLKLAARALGIRRLELAAQGGTVTFEERNSLEPATVVGMIQKNPREYRLEGSLKLRISRPLQTETVRFEFAAELMKRLSEKPKPQPADKPRPGPSAGEKPRSGKRH
jgi:transcription-repair coupling factor (superfamily II helicase)